MSFITGIRDRIAGRREDPFADTELLQPPGTAQTVTMLRAPGPATDVSGADTGSMPKVPALPQRQPAQAWGKWDTEETRDEVARIFGGNAHGVATMEQLAHIKQQAEQMSPRRQRAYVIPEPPDMTRTEAATSPQRIQPGSAESARAMQVLAYPEPGTASREEYAAVMRRAGAATGTSSRYEHPASWPTLPSAPGERVLAWMPQRPARLAIEAPKQAAS